MSEAPGTEAGSTASSNVNQILRVLVVGVLIIVACGRCPGPRHQYEGPEGHRLYKPLVKVVNENQELQCQVCKEWKELGESQPQWRVGERMDACVRAYVSKEWRFCRKKCSRCVAWKENSSCSPQ